jgi:hypothetical protein
MNDEIKCLRDNYLKMLDDYRILCDMSSDEHGDVINKLEEAKSKFINAVKEYEMALKTLN